MWCSGSLLSAREEVDEEDVTSIRPRRPRSYESEARIVMVNDNSQEPETLVINQRHKGRRFTLFIVTDRVSEYQHSQLTRFRSSCHGPNLMPIITT